MTTSELRKATPQDIFQRVMDANGAGYLAVPAVPSVLGWGMGDAQLGISVAVDEALKLGLVRIIYTKNTTYGRNVRFLAVAADDTQRAANSATTDTASTP